MALSTTRQNFYQEVNQPDEKISLARAALYLAQEEYPDLDVEEYLGILDQMAEQVHQNLPQERYPLRVLKSINQYLYKELGFQGNTSDYYDPRNSFLNQVIDRRTGIPITLSLVYLEIARRIDFPMVGIGMPGHFLIRPDFEEIGIFVDAFNQGEILFEEDCQERLAQIYQCPLQLEPQFLEPVTSRQFLARMLTNLKIIYLNQRDLHRTIAVVERLLVLFPEAPKERRDRGLLYYQLGNFERAAADLEVYLELVPNAEDRELIHHLLSQIE